MLLGLPCMFLNFLQQQHRRLEAGKVSLVSRYVALCCVDPRCAMLCHAVLCYAVPCTAASFCAVK